jgi:uncharacterized lipoprotein NlpE involved in copper resistance
MKSIITLSAITGLAALALVGCNQSNSGSSTDMPSTNAPAVNNVPDMNTNLPATNSVPNLNTNLVSVTN